MSEIVILARDVVTDVGEIVAGTPVPAVPAVDGGWQLELSLPGAAAPPHPFDVPASAVRNGRSLLTRQAAHTDYQFAREILGYSHQQAMAWLMRGYGASERQLYRWGFHHVRTGLAS